MRHLVVFSFVILSASCTRSPEGSDLDHTFGQTSRAPKSELKACSVAPTSDPVIDAAQRYISEIARFIMNKNAAAFSGPYAAGSFCFEVQNNRAVNAFASPNERKVTFFTGMLEAMANDGQIAAVMAHELAHVTMQHIGIDENEAIANDPRWQARGPGLKQNLMNLTRQQDELQLRLDAVWGEQESLEASLNANEMANTRAMRLQLEESFVAILDQINSQAMRGGGSFQDMIALSAMLTPPTPRLVMPDALAMPSDGVQSSSFAALRASIAGYLNDRDAWIAAEEQSAPNLWSTYRGLAARAAQVSQQYAALFAESQAINMTLDELRKEIAGEGANNLEEKEADDVALEFYLRAGLAPLNFLGMVDVLNTQEQEGAASCMLQNEANSPTRGNGSHPTACWRYYNAKVLEMSGHAKEYEAFINKAVVTEIAPGSLDRIKSALSQRSAR